ncbi:hypothetical protein TorRG33x02_206640 [Trema orientale]|uniref:Uncharacterized protein n=1 Tax=Trema orientale TaxID=63057 RepID=A0A2P5ED89_TREOI|nr:hypothetical protein TorRG33x02_206640 [Trema orientale]
MYTKNLGTKNNQGRLKPGECQSPQTRLRQKPSSPVKAKALKPGEGKSPQDRRRQKPSALAKAKALRWPLQMFRETSLGNCHHQQC